MRRPGKRWLIGFAAALAALALGVSALGYFTASGSGSASSTVDDTDPVSLDAGDPVEFLYPGTSADVAVTITNPNPGRVFIGSLVIDPSYGDDGFAVDGAHGDCDLSALAYVTQDNNGDGWFVPGSNDPPAELELDLADAISMDTSAASECQGAEFTVYLAVGT